MSFRLDIHCLLLVAIAAIINAQVNQPPHDFQDHEVKQLYIFHQEESSPKETLKFHKDLWANKDLVSKIDVSFRYWTDSDLGLFRAVADNKAAGHIDLHLNVTGNWTNGLIGQISESEWNDMKLLDGDLNYTVAFKDIQVKYLEYIATNNSQWPQSPIHGYKSQETLSNIQRTKTSSHLLSVNSSHAKFTLQNSITKDSNQNLFQFSIFTIPSEKQHKIELKLNSAKNGCTHLVDSKASSDIRVECEIATEQLKSFTVTLSNHDKGFILQNSRNVSLSTQELQLGELFALNGNSSKPYVSLIDSQTDNHDQCYTLVTSHPQTQIEIYLTFLNHKQGKLLTKFIYDSPKSFCVNDFIALRHLKAFQLTLLFNQDLPKDFTFLLLAQTFEKHFTIKTPWQTNAQAQTRRELTTSWYYYNADWFDFEIHGPESAHSESVKFYACDIVANCFPYDSYIKYVTEHRIHYRLRDEFKAELAHTPFIRIAIDKSLPEGHKFDLSYVKSIENDLKLIQTEVQFDSTNLTFPVSVIHNYRSIIYRPSVRINRTSHETSKSFTLKVPINHIDLRVHRLVVLITENLAYEKNQIILKKLTFVENISGTTERHDLSEIFNIKRTVNQAITISTEELLFVEPHEVKQKSLSGYFNIELEVKPEKDYATVQVELKLEEGELKPATRSIQQIILPTNLPKTQNHSTLNSQNPKALITTGLVRLGIDQQIPNHQISIKFGSNQTLNPQDIQIKKLVTSQTFINAIETTQKAIQLDPTDSTKATFTDKTTNHLALAHGSGAFELIYIVELKSESKNDIWIEVEHFIMEDPINLVSTKLKLAGPVIATFDERFDRFECPANFHTDETQRSCDQTQIYQESITECSNDSAGSKSVGCGNIFQKPLSVINR